MLGRHDESGHGRGESEVSEVEGEEGKETSRAAGMEKVKSRRQAHGSIHIPLLVLLHRSLFQHDCQVELRSCGFRET